MVRGIPEQAWRQNHCRYQIVHDRALDAFFVVDLADIRGRSHYFLGYYTDVATRLWIESSLRPGDSFVDVGAHHGVHTLCAARRVGSEGRVFAFEPDPRSAALLRTHMAMNAIGNCDIHEMALGDNSGTLDLSPRGGCSTLRQTGSTDRIPVTVRRACDVLPIDELPGRIAIKIDTEGFEYRVLRGLEPMLDRDDTIVCLEVTDSWLRELGSSGSALFEELRGRDYDAYTFEAIRNGTGWQLRLVPLPAPLPVFQYDVIFLRGDPRVRLPELGTAR